MRELERDYRKREDATHEDFMQVIDIACEQLDAGINPEDVLQDEFGLEPDYVFDLLEYYQTWTPHPNVIETDSTELERMADEILAEDKPASPYPQDEYDEPDWKEQQMRFVSSVSDVCEEVTEDDEEAPPDTSSLDTFLHDYEMDV